MVRVTGVRLNSTQNGLEVILETSSEQQLQTSIKREGNSTYADISNTILALPEGQEFRAVNPVDGIISVSVTQLDANTIRVSVTGEKAVPTAQIGQSANTLILRASRNEEIDEENIEITITGTRTARLVQDSPATITVIDTEEIERNLVQDLEDLVRYEPGISVSRSPNRYGFQDFNIRGIEGNRVLIQVDGVRLPEAFEFGSTQLGRDYIDPETIKIVEIIRGSASTLYGSDAIGGVVTFFTKDPADFLNDSGDDAYGSVKLAYDGVDRGLAETVTLAGRYGQLEGLVIYTRRDNYEAQINSDREPNPQISGSNNWLAKLVYNFNEFNTLKLTGEFLYRTTDTEVLTSRGLVFTGGPSPSARVDNLDATDEVKRDRYSLNYEYNQPNSPLFFQVLRAQIYYQDAESTERSDELRRITRPVQTGPADRLRFRDSLYQQNTLGGDIQLESNFRTGSLTHRIVYGTEVSNTRTSRLRDGFQENLQTGVRTPTVGPDTFPVKDIADTDNFRFGVYLQNEITWGNLTLIPGIRYDSYRLTPDPDAIYQRSSNNFPTGEFSDSAISPRVGLVYKITPEFTAFAQYARGFRAPTAEDINPGFTNPGIYQVIANPDLKAESSNGFELGLRGNFGGGNFSVSGFYNNYQNFIDTFGRIIPTPGLAVGTFQTVNRGSVRIYGVEGKGELRFGSGFSLLASTSYAVGDDLDSDEALGSIDPFRAVVGLRYRAPLNNWGVDLSTTYAGVPRLPRTTDLPNPFVPDSYFTVDLTSYYNITPNVSINFGVFNIFNEKYWRRGDVRGLSENNSNLDVFVQPGITVSAGVRIAF
ncbi:MAG TPA: TonB-dependent hemoglobin/transferrin/lactoferrin family receptor [Cyanobacteria bacterium UBA11369]|nr:TonB-dependent hemoglobin/transferrin/lactoferrin family receptor [Cyanobacteria bacterium UBA11371]HBE34230.1 TonB-dependent hemoglobin/transferrin/lactoferrin family receptor [Cyanobacteria bacterium UBA11368]HBE53282.1 TonB-dependent hemoglobin/transferrin/lactoferrin family receptor [Cyanobacteria bacterium UBA11369]